MTGCIRAPTAPIRSARVGAAGVPASAGVGVLSCCTVPSLPSGAAAYARAGKRVRFRLVRGWSRKALPAGAAGLRLGGGTVRGSGAGGSYAVSIMMPMPRNMSR
ncbi:hypothetical protein GCM10007079_32930 [Nocardiopsis terrae]|nr:hypothetical protein GCM10007079_32930 [Nocardiopsis terrae]